MTKTEFIVGLKSRLNLLNENECMDILEEYIGHIDMKMLEGKTEAEAIGDFGNLDDLADEILAAYHIDKTKLQDNMAAVGTDNKSDSVWSGVKNKIKTKTEKFKADTITKTEKIKEKSEEAVDSIKTTAKKSGGMFKRFFAGTFDSLKKATKVTGNIAGKLTVIGLKVMGLLCLWAPCAFVTIGAIVCTAMVMLLYFATGIGFAGVCIAGVGVSVICVGIMLWLTEIFSGGEAENA